MDACDHEVFLCQALDVGQWDKYVQLIVFIGMSDTQQSKDETDVLYWIFVKRGDFIESIESNSNIK